MQYLHRVFAVDHPLVIFLPWFVPT